MTLVMFPGKLFIVMCMVQSAQVGKEHDQCCVTIFSVINLFQRGFLISVHKVFCGEKNIFLPNGDGSCT